MASRSDLQSPGSLEANLSYQELAPVAIEAEKPWFTDPDRLLPMGLMIVLSLTLAPMLFPSRNVDTKPAAAISPSTGGRQLASSSPVDEPSQPAKPTETLKATPALTQSAAEPRSPPTAAESLPPFAGPGRTVGALAGSNPAPRLVSFDEADLLTGPENSIAVAHRPDPSAAAVPTESISMPPATADVIPAATPPAQRAQPMQVAALIPETPQARLPNSAPQSRSNPPGAAARAIAEPPGEITCFAGCDSARRRNRARASAALLRVADSSQTARSVSPAGVSDGPQDAPPDFNAIECIAGCGSKPRPTPALPEPTASTDAPGRIIVRRGWSKAKAYSPN